LYSLEVMDRERLVGATLKEKPVLSKTCGEKPGLSRFITRALVALTRSLQPESDSVSC
jgi:hypothetical protein